jgi:protein phosphatase
VNNRQVAKGGVKVAGKSDIGKKRSNNQDSILVSESLQLFAVADGMGGHSGGEVASAIAVKTLEKIYAEMGNAPCSQKITEAVKLCNKAIHEQARLNPKLQGMGTTLTAAALDGSCLHIAQVGDSRCYLYRDSELFQITEDHSQVYELLKAGLITDANMAQFQKNVITRSVGYERDVQVDLFVRHVSPGDRYLICSDGLSGMVTNEQIARVLQNFPVDSAVFNLVDLANLQGGEDNVSVVVFEVT